METATSKRYFDADPLGHRYEAHIDVGTQADIRPPRPDVNASYSDDEYSSHGRSRVVSGLWDSGRRYLSRVTSTRSTGQQHYSRQDFMEQYCVTPHQLKALDKIANAVNNHQGGGLFGCLSSNQQGSVCSRSSLLSLCVGRQSNGAEEMAQYWPQKPLRASDLPPAPPPPANQAGRGGRGRYQWVPEQADEAYLSLERPRPIPIAGFPTQDFQKPGEGSGGRLIGQGNMKITEEQIRQAQARMRGFNHTEPNTPLSSRKGHALDIDERRGSKHVSFMEHRSGLVRSQTTSSFEESSASARWRLAKSQERLLDGPMIKPKKALVHCFTHEEESPAKKTVIMEKLKRATMKTQATQTELPLPAVVQKPPREKRHHHHHHHQHGYLSLSPRSMHKSTQAQRTRTPKSYSASCGGSTAAQSQASDISCISGSTSGWEQIQDSADDDEHVFKERPYMQRSQSAQPSMRHKSLEKRDLSPRYKEIFIDFEPNPNKISPQPSPKAKRPLHKTLSEGEILLERRRIQHSDYIDRQCESSATVEDAELYGRHFDPTSPEGSPPLALAKKSSEGTDGTNGSMFSSSSLLDEEEFHENILLREGLFGKRRLSLDGRSIGRSEDSEFSDDKGVEEGERRPQSQPATVINTSGLLLLPDTSKQTGGSSCDSLSVSGYTGSQQNTWRESQATVIGVNNSDPETMGSMSEMSNGTIQKRGILVVSQQPDLVEEDGIAKSISESRKSPSPQPPKTVSSPYSNKASPRNSPSLLRPSTACLDVSETSEDYITATDNSGATDSSSRLQRPDGQHEPSGTSSSNLGEGGSSFESASSMQSKDEEQVPLVEPVGGDSTPTPRPDLIEGTPKAPAETASPSSPSAESSSSQGSYSLQGSSAADADQAHSSPQTSAKSKQKPPLDVSAVDQQPTLQQVAQPPAPWGEEERTKAKRGFKLDLPNTPSPSKNEAGIPVTKPPRRKQHRHGAVEQGDASTPGMVRSPAMHQGFRAEDWVVQRASPVTSLPTPSASNIPPSERISPQTASMAVSPSSRRLQAMRHDSSSSTDEEVRHRTPSPSARSPTNCKTLPRASPRRRPARSPTASLQRPIRRKSVSEEMKGMSTSQTALPAITHTASSVRRKSAPKICSPVKGPDGKIVPPEKLLSPHPHLKFHSLGRKSGSNKASPVHIVKAAVSAESLRSVSPGSDSVFYDPQLSGSPSTAAGTDTSPQPAQAEAPANGNAFIVKPPEGFGDSPEGPKKTSGRLYKKLEKRRFKSEERGSCGHQHKEGSGTHPRRHQHRACKHATARAKSEERRGEKGENTKVASSRSANSSLELLRAAGSSPNMQTENPDEIGVIYGSFRSTFWLYISPRDEKLVWKKPLPVTPVGSPPTSPDGSTCSERDFRRRYQAVTHRMVHRRASAEMFERLAARTFETEQTVTVRKGDGEFGFRIHGSRPVVVSAIEPATPAESSGLEVGDIVISVNGVNVLDASHSEVVKIAHAGSEVLQLEVARTRHLISPDDSDSPECIAGVERCGHLVKKTPTGGQWVHRWFVLRADGCLYYYKTPSLESRPLGAILVSQYTVSAPEPAALGDGSSEPRWLIRLLKDGALAMTLGADSQAERDQWLSSLYTAATTPIKWEDRLVNRGTLALGPSEIINPDCFGFLNKLGRRWRNWNRLYCVLKDACLFLFPSSDSPRASGLLCLHGYRVQTASAGGKRFAFDLLAPESKQKHFYFHTDTELDKKRWMAALEYSIDRWLKIA